MTVRHHLLKLAECHHLSHQDTQQLLQAAGLTDEPTTLAMWLPRGVAILAAALGGLGVVMWIAANWPAMGRMGHFALLQSLVLATSLGAAFSDRARAPLGLLALLVWVRCLPILARPIKPVPTPGNCLPGGPYWPCRCAWVRAQTCCGHRGLW